MVDKWTWTIKGLNHIGEPYEVSADYVQPLSAMSPNLRERTIATQTLEEGSEVTLAWLREGWDRWN